MTGPSVRDEVIALRRRGLLAPLPVGVALVASTALAFVDRHEIGWIWIVVLAVGVPTWIAMDRQARERDALVLARGDDVVRSYLRGRLATHLAGTKPHLVLLATAPMLLLGLVLATDSTSDRPVRLIGAQFLLLGGALAASSLRSAFVVRPAQRRRLEELGGASVSPQSEPWLAEVSSSVVVALGVAHAAILWNEVTGAPMGAAKKAVLGLPEPVAPVAAPVDAMHGAAAPPTLPPERVRERVTALLHDDLGGQAVLLVLLAALFLAEEWGKGGSPGSLASETWAELTSSQQVYAWIAVATLLVAWSQWTTHRQALAAGPSAALGHYGREIEKRLKRASRWSAIEIVLGCLGVIILGTGFLGLVVGGESPGDRAGWSWMVESVIFLLWLAVLPFAAKRRVRPRLEREQNELAGAGEPPPLVA